MARSNWEPNVWKKMGRNDHKIRENVKKEKMEEDEEEGRKKELERARENTKGMWVFGVISTNFMIISSETRERWPWTGMVGSRNIKKKYSLFPLDVKAYLWVWIFPVEIPCLLFCAFRVSCSFLFPKIKRTAKIQINKNYIF